MPTYTDAEQTQDVATTGSGLGAGAGPHLPVGDYGGMDYRSAIRFAKPAAWTAWTAITNATLTFYISDHAHVAPKNSSIFCSRMNVPVWTKDQGTQSCNSGFSASNNTLYADIQSVSTNRITFASGSIANAQKSLNVTAFIQYYWANNSDIVFVFDNNGADQYTEIWSLGSAYDASLSIDYETAGPPQTITAPLLGVAPAVYAPTLVKFSADQALALALLDGGRAQYNMAVYRIAPGPTTFGLPLLGGWDYPATVLAKGPRAYWRLGEPSGNPQDSAGTNHVTAIGGTVARGVAGAIADDPNTAVTFDGVNNYFNMPGAAALNTGDIVTVEAWIIRGATGTVRAIMSRGRDGYYLRLTATGALEFLKSFAASIVTATTAVPATGYHHVVATKNGATTKLYLDTVDVTGTVVNATLNSGGVSTAASIGSDDQGNQDRSNATIDEVAVYPTALTPAQILENYLAGVTPGTALAVLYAPLVILDKFLTVPLLTSTSALYAPTVVRGAAPPQTAAIPLLDAGDSRILPDASPVNIATGPLTVALRFTANRAGRVSHVRYYHAAVCLASTTHVVSVWADAGYLLDSADDVHTTNPGAGWREVELPSPVVVDAGFAYRVSVFFATSGERASLTLGAPPASLTPDLTTGSCYTIAADAFPTTVYSSTYHVDVVYYPNEIVFAPSVILGAAPAPAQTFWTTPADTIAVADTTPTLTFLVPTAPKAMHFQMQLDMDVAFGSVDVNAESILDQTGWEYWNGSGWVPVTVAGVSQTFAGNEARYTVQSPLVAGTYYRRVRAGVL